MNDFQSKLQDAFQQAQAKAAARAREFEQEARKVIETLGDRAQAEVKTLLQHAQASSREQLGILGAEQLDWLKKDLEPLSASTPVVVFAHIPLWAVYPQWGWGTDDAEQALGFLKRFGSVTVLNGHIHQTVKKVEGNITFHTAMSTAFPQPAPGTAPKPGPMKVEAERLSSVLGITDVNYVEGNHTLAVVDSTLA